RVVKESTRHYHEISLAAGDDRLGHFRAGNHSDRPGCDARPAADRVGEWNLVTGVQVNLLARVHAAARAVHQVYLAALLEDLRELDALLDIPAALHPVGAG